MSMNKLPFSNFDLPRQHLGPEGHYVPPKARADAEIIRRRALPSGTLLLEQQQKGIEIAGKMFAIAAAGEERKYVAGMIALAAINTGWYAYAQGADDVMRRRLELPKMADHETDQRQTSEELTGLISQGLDAASKLAATVQTERAANRDRFSTMKSFGRCVGNVALLAAVDHHNAANISGNAYIVQKEVRDIALTTLESARQAVHTTGAHPSFAQFADLHGPQVTHLYNHAPNGVVEAFEQAAA